MMLFVEATGVTSEELAELRANHDIAVRSGEPMLLRVRKVEERIVWSIERLLREAPKKAETPLATAA